VGRDCRNSRKCLKVSSQGWLERRTYFNYPIGQRYLDFPLWLLSVLPRSIMRSTRRWFSSSVARYLSRSMSLSTLYRQPEQNRRPRSAGLILHPSHIADSLPSVDLFFPRPLATVLVEPVDGLSQRFFERCDPRTGVLSRRE